MSHAHCCHNQCMLATYIAHIIHNCTRIYGPQVGRRPVEPARDAVCTQAPSSHVVSEALKPFSAAMPGSCSTFGGRPSPCPLQRSSAPSWQKPAAWTVAKGAAPQVTQRTAERWQQRRSAQITCSGLRPVDRNFRLTTPAEETNKLTGTPHTAESSGNSNRKPATPRWRLELLLLELTKRRITARQKFSCCIACTRYDMEGEAREEDIGFFCISVSMTAVAVVLLGVGMTASDSAHVCLQVHDCAALHGGHWHPVWSIWLDSR